MLNHSTTQHRQRDWGLQRLKGAAERIELTAQQASSISEGSPGGTVSFVNEWLSLWLPVGIRLHHNIEYGEQFSHAGDKGNFFRLTRST